MNYILALGSNTEDRVKFLNAALSGLNKIGQVLSKSSLYESKPYGYEEQLNFLNAVCIFKFSNNAFRLLRKIKQIETESGRTKSFHWGPRQIDIDVVEWDGPVVESDVLTVPHKDMGNRAFVLKPLMELLPEFHTRNGESVRKLFDKLNDKYSVSLSNKQW